RRRGAQAAKQARSQCRPHAGNLVEHRADGPLRPQLLVIRDREAVRLVTDLLQRLERGRGQVEDEGLEPIRRVYLLRSLGQGGHGQIVEPERLEGLEPRAQLTATAI